jgi:hypothetical protein
MAAATDECDDPVQGVAGERAWLSSGAIRQKKFILKKVL